MDYTLTIADDFSSQLVFGTIKTEDTADEDGLYEIGDLMPLRLINIPPYPYLRSDWDGSVFDSNLQVELFVSGYLTYFSNNCKAYFDDNSEPDLTPHYCPEFEAKKYVSRQKRNALLAESDWTQVSDNALTDEVKAAWATYRTNLRNIPDHVKWPYLSEEDWPQKP